MEKQEAIRKIKKLMKLADPERGASAGEIENALAMIDRLMRENNIHQAQVMTDDDAIKVDEAEAVHVSNVRVWQRFVLTAVAKLCECQGTMQGRRGQRWRNFSFIGTKDDIELARELFTSFLNTIQLNAQTFYRDAVNRRSYCDGYAHALLKRAQEIVEARKANPGTALVFVGRKALAIKKKVDDDGFTTERGASMSDNQTKAFLHGRNDGNAADLTAKRQPRKIEQ